MKKYYSPIIILIIAIIVSAVSISLAINFLLPLLLGAAIAIIMEPIVGFIERKTKLNRGLISGIVIILFFLIIGYLAILLITRITFELSALIKTLPNFNYYYDIILNKLSSYFLYYSTQVPADVLTFLRTNIKEILSAITGILTNLYGILMNRLGAVPNLIVELIILVVFTFLFSYLISKDKNKLTKLLKNLAGDALQEKIKKLQVEIVVSFFKLLKAQLLLVTFTTAITVIGFYLLGVKYALILGIICGILDILPVVGPSLIFVSWIIFSLIMGNISFAVSLFILYIITLVSRQILQAQVIGENLGIDPLLTLSSIYLGIKIFGFLGLFIGPLVVVIIKTLLQSGIIPPLFKPNSKLTKK